MYWAGAGPSFQWKIFDGGRLRSAIVRKNAGTDTRWSPSYEQRVLAALEEVESAFVAHAQERGRRDALNRSATAAEDAVQLVKALYTTGLTDFRSVLETEYFPFQQQAALAEREDDVMINLIRL